MDWGLSDTELAIQETVREFADAEVRPTAYDRDANHSWCYAEYKRCGELGITGIPFPEAHDGSDSGWMVYALALEELARADLSVASAVYGAGRLASRILEEGTEEQKQRWALPLIQGTHVASFGLTEADAGSDNKALRTTARLENGHWVINGAKQFISLSGTDISLFTAVVCATDIRPDGRKEFSIILVPHGTPGYVVGPGYRKLGTRSADTHPLTFEDCRVPAENLLGERGKGLHRALGSLVMGRVLTAAMAVGLAQACIDECLRYAHERVAFGRPIGAFQAIQHQIAHLVTDLTAARLMYHQGIRLFDAGKLTPGFASQIKYFATEMVQRTATAACDIFGGMGFMDESPVSRYYRDAKLLTIVEGTTNIQRTIIARELGLPRAF